MKKKSSAGIVIAVVLGIILLGGVIISVVLAKQRGWFKDEQEVKIPLINFYLKAMDKRTGEFVDANYILDYTANKIPVIISRGTVQKDSFTEINGVPCDRIIHIHCWSDNHYLVKVFKTFSAEEIQMNASQSACKMERIGNLSITSTGNLKEGMQKVTLNISSDNYFYRMGICASWTAGIIDISLPDQLVECNSGFWFNWSHYNITTGKYHYFDQNYYRCGECIGIYCEWAEQCEYVSGNKCKIYSMETPLRFKQKTDSCWNIGKTLNNESIIIEFLVKSEGLNQNDEVNFYVFDKDRRFSQIDGRWLWMTEFQGENVGNPSDFTHKVK